MWGKINASLVKATLAAFLVIGAYVHGGFIGRSRVLLLVFPATVGDHSLPYVLQLSFCRWVCSSSLLCP